MSNRRLFESFSFGEVVTLSRVNPRTLDHWASTGFLRPSIRDAMGTGTRRAYSFADLVAARAAKELRFAGISLQRLRKVVEELRKREFSTDLAEACLIVSGKEVFVKDNQYLVSMLAEPGQMHLPFTVLNLRPTITVLRSELDQMRTSTDVVIKTPRRSRQLTLDLGTEVGVAAPPKPSPKTAASIGSQGNEFGDSRDARGRRKA